MAKHLTAVLALAGAATVQAAPITASQTINLADLLAGNGTKNISFDLNSQLAAFGRGAGDLMSVDLIVYGYSDAQYGQPDASPYSGYEHVGSLTRYVSYPISYPTYVPRSCYYSVWGSGSCYGGYTYYTTYYSSYPVTDSSIVRSRDIAHRDAVADTMTVNVAGQVGSDAVSDRSSSATPYGQKTHELTTGDYNNGYQYRYNRERDTYEAIFGDLEVAMHLNPEALKSLTSDGILDALISAPLGQFNLKSAVLNFTVGDSKVPEPGTLGLVGAAVLAGVVARRRRSKKK